MNIKEYDFIIVGAGLFGAVCANELKRKYKCLVMEKNNYIGGACATEICEGIVIHKFGPHFFNTNNDEVYKYLTSLDEFIDCKNSPIAKYKNEVYNLPFNMNTFNKLFNVTNPSEAKKVIERQCLSKKSINTVEDFALANVGKKIYKKLIKGYTEKQWGVKCNELPAYILKRLPIKYIYDNDYFDKKYSCIPKYGYSHLINKMLEGVCVKFNCDFNDIKNDINPYTKVIFTGSIDSLYNYDLGKLEYRSLRFEHKLFKTNNYQGNIVVNYTDKKVPYTRSVEHKHFDKSIKVPYTYVTFEYPCKYSDNNEPYYPIDNNTNKTLYKAYYTRINGEYNRYIIGGRLGMYKYMNMDEVVEKALEIVSPFTKE